MKFFHKIISPHNNLLFGKNSIFIIIIDTLKYIFISILTVSPWKQTNWTLDCKNSSDSRDKLFESRCYQFCFWRDVTWWPPSDNICDIHGTGAGAGESYGMEIILTSQRGWHIVTVHQVNVAYLVSWWLMLPVLLHVSIVNRAVGSDNDYRNLQKLYWLTMSLVNYWNKT